MQEVKASGVKSAWSWLADSDPRIYQGWGVPFGHTEFEFQVEVVETTCRIPENLFLSPPTRDCPESNQDSTMYK